MQELMRQQQDKQQQQEQQETRNENRCQQQGVNSPSIVFDIVYTPRGGRVVCAYVCISGAACDGVWQDKKTTEQKERGEGEREREENRKIFSLAAGPMGRTLCVCKLKCRRLVQHT